VEKPGSLKQIAVTAAPLLAAAGLVAINPFAAAAALTHPLAASVASLGPNLLASGIAAYCRPDRLLAGKDHQEHLANHDILRLIRTSWGDAAAASLRQYVEAHPAHSVSLKYQPPAAFLKILQKITPEDFHYAGQITLVTVREAIDSSRRTLLPAPNGVVASLDVQQHVAALKAGLVDSVIDAIRKTSGERLLEMPPGFESFIAGDDPRFPGGILDQLCTYVALYLKTDARAQTALLHFTLQDLSDRQLGIAATQDRLADLARRIYETQVDSQKVLLHDFEARTSALAQTLTLRLDQAFNRFVCPRLEAPFDDAAESHSWSFTYRSRATPLIGRDAAMEALIRFMADPRPGLWTVISGPAGSGKNRLAAN